MIKTLFDFRAYIPKKNIILDNEDIAYITHGNNKTLVPMDGCMYLQSEFILLQHIGKLDKNNKKAYTGHIIRFVHSFDEERIGYIDFENGAFVVKYKYRKGDDGTVVNGTISQWNDGIHEWYSIENLDWEIDVEIIGDIFTTPNLLPIL